MKATGVADSAVAGCSGAFFATADPESPQTGNNRFAIDRRNVVYRDSEAIPNPIPEDVQPAPQ